MDDKEKIEAIKKIFDQSRMKRMSLAEEFGEEELTGMNNAIEKIVYSQRIRKMTITDKEKIEEVLGILEKKIKDYEYDWKEFRGTKQQAEASRFRHMKELLEEIKEILEKQF